MRTPSPISSIVVDASFAVVAVTPSAQQLAAQDAFVDWARREIQPVAPAHWIAECVSALRRSVFRDLKSGDEGHQAFEDLFGLGVRLLPVDLPRSLAALRWAERLGQSRAYDAFYVALGEELHTEVWTADQRLANAARQAGATWVRSIV